MLYFADWTLSNSLNAVVVCAEGFGRRFEMRMSYFQCEIRIIHDAGTAEPEKSKIVTSKVSQLQTLLRLGTPLGIIA
jgi:hypothetical protein